jgi:hypothetical protein
MATPAGLPNRQLTMEQNLSLGDLQTNNLRMVSCVQDDTSQVPKIARMYFNEDTFSHDAQNFFNA